MLDRKRKYCCDASRLAYENYYLNQVGNGMPIFVGSRGQRGHGIGNILGGLFKSAAPILKKGLQTAAKSGLALVGDVLEGKNAAAAARARAAQGIKQFVSDDDRQPFSVNKGLKTAAQSGLAFVGDVLEGRNAARSAKARAAQGIKRFVEDDEPVSRKKAKRSEHRSKKKRRHTDVFA